MTVVSSATRRERLDASGPGRRPFGLSDRTFRWLLRAAVAIFAAVLAAIVVSLVIQARPALVHDSWSLITSTTWQPSKGHFGALAVIVGTLLTTFLALLVAVPLGLAAAIALTSYVPHRLRAALSTLVELLAAVPSVIYGLWGLLVVSPWMAATLSPWLKRVLGWTGLFNGPSIGVGLLLAGMILSIMILPTMTAISRDVLAAVPDDQLEAATALGGTSWQAVAKIAVPAARTGILGAVVLSAGRALGETIAVTMVIGDRTTIPNSLLAPAQTMASLIANEFTEATEAFHLSSLIAVGLLLLLIALVINAGARLLVRTVAGTERGIGLT